MFRPRNLCDLSATSGEFSDSFRIFCNFFHSNFIKNSNKFSKNSFKKWKKIVGKMVVKWSTGTCDNGPLTDCCWVNNNFFFLKKMPHTQETRSSYWRRSLSVRGQCQQRSSGSRKIFVWSVHRHSRIPVLLFRGGGRLFTCFGTEIDLSSF